MVVGCGEHVLTTKLKDAELLAAYQDQHKVETAMRWLKGPLSVAPIFLKTEERIAALGLVYVRALMIYALIQRHARAALAAAKTTMPGNKGWTDKPTTEVIFRLFEGVQTIRIASAGVTVVKSLHTEHVRLPEGDEAGLLRVKREAVFPKSLRKDGLDPARVPHRGEDE